MTILSLKFDSFVEITIKNKIFFIAKVTIFLHHHHHLYFRIFMP